jgi:hypothetical protein
MKQEWRKIIQVHPAVLYKSDVMELVKIVSECEAGQYFVLSIEYEYEGLSQTLTTIEDLENFSKDVPTDKLSIKANIYTEDRDIVSSISITMHQTYIDYQIHANNEAWFLGKIAQLTKFFKSRKPWYSFITRIISFVGPALVMSGFYIGIFAIKNTKIVWAILGFFLAFSMVMISYYSYEGKLFPHVRIYAKNKEKKFVTYELVSIVIAILALIVSVIGTILIPILQKKP